MILVYSKNVMVINAIKVLADKRNRNSVFHFEDKNTFLVCSIIFEHATKIIDVVDFDRIKEKKWLMYELDTRNASNVYYISHSRESYFLGVVKNIICDIDYLEFVIWVSKSLTRKACLQCSIVEYFKDNLPTDFIEFLRKESFVPNGAVLYKNEHGAKKYFNMRYKVRQKLKLKNRFEYGILIYVLRSVSKHVI